MAKQDFTKYKNGSIFRTRDEYLSGDGFNKGVGHYRKVVKTGINKNNSGIKVVKLQSNGEYQLKHSHIGSSYNPFEYIKDNQGKPINDSYKFKAVGDEINIHDLNFMNKMLSDRNKIIKKNYAIKNSKGKKKKTPKKKS